MRMDVLRLVGFLCSLAIAMPVWVCCIQDRGLMCLAFILSMSVLWGTINTLWHSHSPRGVKSDDLLYDTLPLRRRARVISHYLVSLICVIVAEIMAAAMLVAGKLVGVKVIDNWWVMVVISVGIFFSFSAIMVPVLIRFGACVEIIGIVVVGIVVVLTIAGFLDSQTPAPEWGQVGWPYLLLTLGLMFYVGSPPVAIRFYERQDH